MTALSLELNFICCNTFYFIYFASTFSFYSNGIFKYLLDKVKPTFTNEGYPYVFSNERHRMNLEFLTVQLRHIRLQTFNSYYSFKSLKKILLFPPPTPKSYLPAAPPCFFNLPPILTYWMSHPKWPHYPLNLAPRTLYHGSSKGNKVLYHSF